jgi:transposase
MAPSSVPPAVPRAVEKKMDPDEPADHALGRSRGGYTTKIHLLCDRHGHPLHVHITPGQTHESQVLETVLEEMNVVGGETDKVLHPQRLVGDKGFRADWIDVYLLDLDIVPVIPSKSNEDREARPVPFDEEAYRQRNIIERLIGWLKENRRILTRFEKTAKNYLGMLKVAFIHRYLRMLLA